MPELMHVGSLIVDDIQVILNINKRLPYVIRWQDKSDERRGGPSWFSNSIL